MDFFKALLVFLWCLCPILSHPVLTGKDIQSKLVKQEHMPSIEYKYLVRTILPQQDRWWRRGTHRFYAEEKEPKVIEA
ncbi:hypothetical protein NQ315_005600 [Exocentrus adspersus]|uniref:Uncharacterized protein n=1 Tax=Exocentrus adspersus TaxID=1586481 RepID=A0AAV8VT40_9CUCU|nr:hypothetical protein NQ315_005600 [Exocentrus adspersus]